MCWFMWHTDFTDSKLNELFMANRKHSGVKDSLNADADSCFQSRVHFIRQICVCHAYLALYTEEGRRSVSRRDSYLQPEREACKSAKTKSAWISHEVLAGDIYRGNTFWSSRNTTRNNNTHPEPSSVLLTHTTNMLLLKPTLSSSSQRLFTKHWSSFIHLRKLRSEGLAGALKSLLANVIAIPPDCNV